MTRIGVISNPKSRQNTRRMDAVRDTLSQSGSTAIHIELGSIGEISAALRELAGRGVDAIAVNGGDGTVQAVMTALVNERPFDDLPPLAVVPAGMTNLIAADVGLDGRPEAALKRLISRARQGDLTSLQRPVLTLAADANEAGIHGMFAGAAAFYDAVIWSRRDIQSKGAERNLAVGLAIASLALRSLFGLAERHPAMTGTPMRIAWDNGPLEEHEIFLLMATTLERMLLRVMPFWEDDSLGRPSDADARVRVTSIDYPPRRLARALLPVLRGNPKGWMKTAGYRSGRVRRLSLACRKPIVFDGEFFDAERFGLPEDSPLIMEHRHNLHFVR